LEHIFEGFMYVGRVICTLY